VVKWLSKQEAKGWLFRKGQCFGEMAYLTGEARSATIISKEECILLKISSTLLEGLSKDIQLLFFKNSLKP